MLFQATSFTKIMIFVATTALIGINSHKILFLPEWSKMFLRQFKAGVEKKRYKFLVILFEFCFLYLALLSEPTRRQIKKLRTIARVFI